jgi:hypothetical protein
MAWGFLFAAAAGVPVVEIGVYLIGIFTVGEAGLLTAIALGTLPAVVLFGLTVRELLLGRREARGYLREDRPWSGEEVGEPFGFGVSLLSVQENQKQISRVRGELEISMIPLILGGIALLEIAGSLVLAELIGPVSQGLTPLEVAFFPLFPLVIIIPTIWALWRVARQWVDQYQRGLDGQVRQLISLEGEFLGRFASPSGGA